MKGNLNFFSQLPHLLKDLVFQIYYLKAEKGPNKKKYYSIYKAETANPIIDVFHTRISASTTLSLLELIITLIKNSIPILKN